MLTKEQQTELIATSNSLIELVKKRDAELTQATEVIHQQAGQLGIAKGIIKFLSQFIKDNGLEPPALPDLLPPSSFQN
jgi:hypothetical protein